MSSYDYDHDHMVQYSNSGVSEELSHRLPNGVPATIVIESPAPPTNHHHHDHDSGNRHRDPGHEDATAAIATATATTPLGHHRRSALRSPFCSSPILCRRGGIKYVASPKSVTLPSLGVASHNQHHHNKSQHSHCNSHSHNNADHNSVSVAVSSTTTGVGVGGGEEQQRQRRRPTFSWSRFTRLRGHHRLETLGSVDFDASDRTAAAEHLEHKPSSKRDKEEEDEEDSTAKRSVSVRTKKTEKSCGSSNHNKSAHHRRERLMDSVLQGDWDAALDRISRCPGEASEWWEVTVTRRRHKDEEVDEEDDEVESCTERSLFLSPLHACALASTRKGATKDCNATALDVVEALLEADGEESATLRDADGRLALHWACESRYEPTTFAVDHSPSQDQQHGDVGDEDEKRNHYGNERKEEDNTSISDNNNNVDESPSVRLRVLRRLLLAHPEGVQAKDASSGRVPLHVACEGGDDDDDAASVVKTLLECWPEGASERDDAGWTPLAVVCHGDAGPDVASLILRAAPAVAGIGDDDDRAPLHLFLASLSRRRRRDAVAFVSSLVDADPSVLARAERRFGLSPLHVACSIPARRDDEVHAVAERVVRALLRRYPAAARCEDDRARSLPMHLACRAEAPAGVVRALLEEWPEAAARPDRDGRVPAHWACSCFRHRAGEGRTTTIEREERSAHIAETLVRARPDAARAVERKYGYAPLHVLCAHAPPGSARAERVHRTLLAAWPGAADLEDARGRVPRLLRCVDATSATTNEREG